MDLNIAGKPWVGIILGVHLLSVVCLIGNSGRCFAEEGSPQVFTLQEAVDWALRYNTQILISKEAVAAAEENKKRQYTAFLPKASARYGYTRLDEEKTYAGFVTRPEDQYRLTATVDQPIFTGFSTRTQYEISSLSLEMQKILEKQTGQDLVLDVKKTYFQLLQEEKLELVAQQAVKQLEEQVRVAQNFYDVGIIPRNDVLEAEVELANAKQDLVVATHRKRVTASRLNTILRRPADALLEVVDILSYEPFTFSYEDAVEKAKTARTEILLAQKEIDTAEKDIVLSKSDYYPAVNLQTNYYRYGEDPAVDGGEGISDRDEWDLMATLSWTFWEWGKTRYGVNEKLRRLEQAKLAKASAEDNVVFEVKEAYLAVKGSESNIMTAEKAVEQAKENFRISEERYKEQVATSTDVLDAQTLLTRAKNNYFNTLSAFNIAKASLERAMGVDISDR